MSASDIQDEAYSEAMAEIERLRNRAEEFEQAANDLAAELATMHAHLYKLITDLRTTNLSPLQASMVAEAAFALGKSQGNFFATYGNMIGGAAPERN